MIHSNGDHLIDALEAFFRENENPLNLKYIEFIIFLYFSYNNSN